MKKVIIGVFFISMSVSAYAGNYSSGAVPTNVELVSGSVLIHGAFGNPNGWKAGLGK